MTTTFWYDRGDAAPGISALWLGGDGEPINFGDGTWSFTGHLVARRNGTSIDVSSRVSGAVGGVNVDWHVGDLDLPEGTTYELVVKAVETATDKPRTYRPRFVPVVAIRPTARRVPAFIPEVPA